MSPISPSKEGRVNVEPAGLCQAGTGAGSSKHCQKPQTNAVTFGRPQPFTGPLGMAGDLEHSRTLFSLNSHSTPSGAGEIGKGSHEATTTVLQAMQTHNASQDEALSLRCAGGSTGC